VREWFAEVHRRVDTGLDPFQDHSDATATGKAAKEGKAGSLGGDPATPARGQTTAAAAAMTGGQVDDDGDDDDEEEDDEEEEESDESEVWQPSRSVRKTLSGSED